MIYWNFIFKIDEHLFNKTKLLSGGIRKALRVGTQITLSLMMNATCPNSPKCPIFNGILADKVTTAKAYRTKYCEAGPQGYKTCKRFLAKEKFGECPPNLLPNAGLSLDEIGARYNLA